MLLKFWDLTLKSVLWAAAPSGSECLSCARVCVVLFRVIATEYEKYRRSGKKFPPVRGKKEKTLFEFFGCVNSKKGCPTVTNGAQFFGPGTLPKVKGSNLGFMSCLVLLLVITKWFEITEETECVVENSRVWLKDGVFQLSIQWVNVIYCGSELIGVNRTVRGVFFFGTGFDNSVLL